MHRKRRKGAGNKRRKQIGTSYTRANTSRLRCALWPRPYACSDFASAPPVAVTLCRGSDIYGPDHGWQRLHLAGLGPLAFEYTKPTIDEDHHLRLVYYAALEDDGSNCGFSQWLKQGYAAQT